MNRRNGRSGFTMVEVIVTAAIVAVAAIIAVTTYSGFMQETRRQAVDALAQAGAAAANAYFRKTGDDPTLDQLHLYYDVNKYDIDIFPERNEITVTDHDHKEITATAQY